MQWNGIITKKAIKQLKNANQRVRFTLRLLVADLALHGPAPGTGWPNYGKLKGKKGEDKRQCHLIKGNPTYVCCWEIISKEKKIIEVYYVGTHEKAPY